MSNLREYQTVVLAALLHDIGKFLHRGRSLAFDIEGPHPEVSGRFVAAFRSVFEPVADVDLLRTLVVHHHQDRIRQMPAGRARELALIVNRADVLSSSERGEAAGEHHDYRTVPLASVFQRVFSVADLKAVMRYHPFSLPTPHDFNESVFPDRFEAYPAHELERTIQAFGHQAGTVLPRLTADFSTVVSHGLALLQTYVSTVPADTQEEVSDTSLYDHMKTTAAIAACLYLVREERNDWEARQAPDAMPSFYLLVGDVSGIQKYVFDIAGTEREGGGIAKRLRARSLFVQLLSEVAPLQILRRFELPPANVLMASGGKFYMLLPAVSGTEQKLESYRETAEHWFLENFQGALGLNLAWVPCAESALGKTFGETVSRLMEQLDDRKQQAFKQALIGSTQWNPSAFVMTPFGEGKRVCRSCGKFEAEPDNLCSQCQADTAWGNRLPEARCISISLEATPAGRNVLGASVDVGGYELIKPGHRTALILHINDSNLEPLARVQASFRHFANYVPRDTAGVTTFKDLAAKSVGRPYLGFLKADVDNLGSIIAFGLRGTKGRDGFHPHDLNNRLDTPSRLATLSRQLDLFFTGWVEHLLETKFRDCYCVFSGGDDLFVIGPWNSILEFATSLHEDFHKYTCRNREMTLSAGIVLQSYHHPVGQAAEEAAKAVEKSKTEGRDRFTLLGHTLTWEKWGTVKKQWEAMRMERTSSAFLYSLLDYASMWRQYRNGDVLGLRFQPLLAYNVKRNLTERDNPHLYEFAQRLLSWRHGSDNEELESGLDNLGLITQLLILWKGGER